MRRQFQKFGFVRVATAAPRLQVADCDYNTANIIGMMARAAKKRVQVLLFPELCITAYTCADLFQQNTLREGALESLAKIVKHSRSTFGGVVVVSLPIEVDDKLFNCAAVICRGKILGVVPKSYLPGYKEFYEPRWFSPAGAAQSTEIELCGQTVAFGTDLLFKATDVNGVIISVETCEDLWVTIPPSSLQALGGATIQLNDSASNELIGKAGYRRDLVTGQSARCMSAYAYANPRDESTTDVTFSNHCLIAENGGLLAECERFSDDEVLLIGDVDVERLKFDRLRTNSFAENQRVFAGMLKFRKIHFQLGSGADRGEVKLERYIEAHPFVPKASAELHSRCDDIFNIQVFGLLKRLTHIVKKTKKAPVVTIGVSGGLDSTLALLVACQVFDKMGRSRKNIRGYTMPGFGTTRRTKGNAHALMADLGVTDIEVDIRAMCLEQMRAMKHQPFGIDLTGLTVDQFVALLEQLPEGSQDLVFENVQARMRTKILMDAGFVVGTGDVSELALGWCTYNGDHMSMYNPNASIPKTLVKFLVRWAAENQFAGDAQKTLLDIVATEISPELLPTGKDGKSKQKTEGVVGPYELHDFFLYYMLRFGMSPEKILYLAQNAMGWDNSYTDDEMKKWLKVFLVRFFNSQFKRSAVPDGPKVGSISLSPRGDWRMPSDAQETLWLKWAEETSTLTTAPDSTQGAQRKATMSNSNEQAGTNSAVVADGHTVRCQADGCACGNGERVDVLGTAAGMSSRRSAEADGDDISLHQRYYGNDSLPDEVSTTSVADTSSADTSSANDGHTGSCQGDGCACGTTVVAVLGTDAGISSRIVKRALGIVDAQNDFTSATRGAKLPVEGGELIGEPIGRLQNSGRYACTFASKDWHPGDMLFFAEVNGLQAYVDQTPDEDGVLTDVYPRHCVADTWGAEYLPGVIADKVDRLFLKGTSRTKDAYSAHEQIIPWLREQGVTDVDLTGIVTRICVGKTALGLIEAGFKVRIIEDACRDLPIAVKFQEVLDELHALGVEFITVDQALAG